MLGTVREPGIMMLTLNDLYTKIEETKEEMTYRVSMAYVEVLSFLQCPLKLQLHNIPHII